MSVLMFRLRGGSKHTTVTMKQNSENFKAHFLRMHHTTFRDLKVADRSTFW